MRGIPSPADRFVRLGPVRASLYSSIVSVGCAGLAALVDRRIRTLGAPPGVVRESTTLGVPFGLLGGRLYHIATSWSKYSRQDRAGLQRAANISRGGLGSWGVLLGAGLGTWIVCRRRGVSMPVYLDCYAPNMAVAVVAVRLGNWCNQEIFGRPTTHAWGVRIDPANRPSEYADDELFEPVFLYESLGAIAIRPVLLVAESRWQFGHGRVFALWLGLYSTLRLGLEFVRSDPAMRVGGQRVNVWTSMATIAASAAYVVIVGSTRPGRNISAMRAPATSTSPRTA